MNELSIEETVGIDEWKRVNNLGRPFVIYKSASTLDGRIAALDGTSQWISSAKSRAEVHALRAICHATVIGSGTQQTDNPNLAVRDAETGSYKIAPEQQPLRVVVDSKARTSANSQILNKVAPTLIVVGVAANAQHLEGLAKIMRVPHVSHGLDLKKMLNGLFDHDVKAVFLEGGPTLAGSFVAERLVDRVISYIAPALLGAGKTSLGNAQINTMADILRLEIVHVHQSGSDVRLISRPMDS